jgi:hypothetical protein
MEVDGGCEGRPWVALAGRWAVAAQGRMKGWVAPAVKMQAFFFQAVLLFWRIEVFDFSRTRELGVVVVSLSKYATVQSRFAQLTLGKMWQCAHCFGSKEAQNAEYYCYCVLLQSGGSIGVAGEEASPCRNAIGFPVRSRRSKSSHRGFQCE